jgi:hypothetical protein
MDSLSQANQTNKKKDQNYLWSTISGPSNQTIINNDHIAMPTSDQG